MTSLQINPRRFLPFLTVLLGAVLLYGCDSMTETQDSVSVSQSRAVPQKAVKTDLDPAFAKLAASLALSLKDRTVRAKLQQEIAERYTGAPEALYHQIKDEAINGGASLREHLAQGYATYRQQTTGKSVSQRQALQNVEEYAGQIPKLHIAMPQHLDEWNPREEIPLVAYYNALKIDDQQQERFTIEAFDSEGTSHQLGVDTDHIYAPNSDRPIQRPVLVLAINERTDSEGNVLKGFRPPEPSEIAPPCNPETDECNGGGGGIGGGTGDGDSCPGHDWKNSSRETGDDEYIYGAKVINDKEPAAIEPADIRFKVVSSNENATELGDKYFEDPEPEDEWHYCEDESDPSDINRKIISWHWDAYGDFLLMVWYESDGGNYYNDTVTYTFEDGNSIAVPLSFQNGDDRMGKTAIHRLDDRNDVFSTGDIKWKDRWKD